MHEAPRISALLVRGHRPWRDGYAVRHTWAMGPTSEYTKASQPPRALLPGNFRPCLCSTLHWRTSLWLLLQRLSFPFRHLAYQERLTSISGSRQENQLMHLLLGDKIMVCSIISISVQACLKFSISDLLLSKDCLYRTCRITSTCVPSLLCKNHTHSEVIVCKRVPDDALLNEAVKDHIGKGFASSASKADLCKLVSPLDWLRDSNSTRCTR
jgi:hypothetical protein